MEKFISIVDNFKKFLKQKNIFFDEEILLEDLFALYFDIEDYVSQTDDELAKLLIKLFKNQKFEEIDKVFLEYIKTTTVKPDILAEYYFNFARFKEISMDYASAEYYYKLALDHAPYENFKFIDGLITVLIKVNNLKAAEKILNKYVESLKDATDKLMFFDSLVMLYISNKKYDKALALTNELINIYNMHYENKTLELAKLYKAKGEIYIEKKNYKNAEKIFFEVLDILKEVDPEEQKSLDYHNLFLVIYSHLSFIAKINENLDVALDYNQKQIYLIRENIFVDFNVNKLIDLFWDNAHMHERIENFEAASKSLQEAINIISDHENDLDLSNDIELIKSYLFNDLGRINKETENFHDAIECYKKAIKIAEKSQQTNIQNLYVNLSLAYTDIGNYDEALKNIKKAEKILENQTSGTILDKIQIYDIEAGIYAYKSDYEKAIDYYKKIIKLNPRGQDNTTVFAYSKLGEMYSYTKNFKASIKYLKKAIEKIGLSGFEDQYKAHVYGLLGIAWAQTQSPDNALSALNKSIELTDALDLPLDFTVVMLYENRGHAYAQKKDLSSAIKAYSKSLDIAKLTIGEDDPYIGQIYNSIALTYAEFQFYDLAIENQKIAYKILSKTSDNQNMLEMIKRSIEVFEKKVKV